MASIPSLPWAQRAPRSTSRTTHPVQRRNGVPPSSGTTARLRCLLLFTAVAVLAAPIAHAKSSKDGFSLGPSGVAANNGDLLIATRLNNTGEKTAHEVVIDSIRLVHSHRLTPVSLPIAVGKLMPDSDFVIQASFSGSFSPGDELVLRVSGRYSCRSHDDHGHDDNGHDDSKSNHSDDDRGRKGGHDDDRCAFKVETPVTVPPAAPGNATLMNGTTPSLTVTGASFPHIPAPQNFDEANESGPPVPVGPFIPLKSVSGGTGPMPAPKPNPTDPPVAFGAIDPLNLVSGSFNGDASTTAEPSGGSSGNGIIFATTNWTADYSTDGGSTFTQLDPTTVFPNDAVGYCCDQVVHYVPKIDRFIWLLQGNGYRIASASPASLKSSGATAWTYWNLTPGFFGLTGSLDYPDMSVGDNDLYLSFDEVGTGLMVVRISLAQIQAGGTIFVEWTDPANGGSAYGGHVMQDTGNEAFWAGQNSTSQMRIFSLAEGSGTYFWRDVNIGSWSNSGMSSTTPDGNDFLTKLRNFPGNAAIGATRAFGPPTQSGQFASDGLWFAWSAGTDRNFAQPHIEMVTLDRSNNFALAQQVQVWNSGYTFVYPALATNACTGEVGMALEGGGNGNYENFLVGFWGDFVAYITTGSSVGTTRYGDYVTLRQDPTPSQNGEFFDAFGYGLNSPAAGQSGSQTDARYVQFGRAGACHQQLQ